MIAQRKRDCRHRHRQDFIFIQDMALEEERKKRRILEEEEHNFIHGTTFHYHLFSDDGLGI